MLRVNDTALPLLAGPVAVEFVKRLVVSIGVLQRGPASIRRTPGVGAVSPETRHSLAVASRLFRCLPWGRISLLAQCQGHAGRDCDVRVHVDCGYTAGPGAVRMHSREGLRGVGNQLIRKRVCQAYFGLDARLRLGRCVVALRHPMKQPH